MTKKSPRYREFILTKGSVRDRFVQLTTRSGEAYKHPTINLAAGHGRHRAPKRRSFSLEAHVSYERNEAAEPVGHYGVPPMSQDG